MDGWMNREIERKRGFASLLMKYFTGMNQNIETAVKFEASCCWLKCAYVTFIVDIIFQLRFFLFGW